MRTEIQLLTAKKKSVYRKSCEVVTVAKTDGKEVPILYKRKEECCGCTACYAVCPKSAIAMVEDEEGFEYPQIDTEKCIGCRMCLKVCPIKGREAV